MKVNPYLNFDGNAREAFEFYQSVFGGELEQGMTFGEMPPDENLKIADEEKSRLMHISLPVGDFVLMGSDISPSLGHKLNVGNNTYISLHPDSKEEADRIFEALSDGAEIEMPMADQFWGDYFGSLIDKFGICWMINFHEG